jgi:hypothetical protein
MHEIKIKHINVIAIANVNLKNEICSCGKHVQAPSQHDLAKKRTNSVIIKGKCEHGVHSSCGKEMQYCPFDGSVWETTTTIGEKLKVRKVIV